MAVASVIYSFGTLVNSVDVMQERQPALVTERIVDSVEAEVTVISVYSVDQAINDEMVVAIEMNYGEMTNSRPIAFQWKILALATHISVNWDDTLGLATLNGIVVTTAILNDGEKDPLFYALEYHYSAKRMPHCEEITARLELVVQF